MLYLQPWFALLADLFALIALASLGIRHLRFTSTMGQVPEVPFISQPLAKKWSRPWLLLLIGGLSIWASGVSWPIHGWWRLGLATASGLGLLTLLLVPWRDPRVNPSVGTGEVVVDGWLKLHVVAANVVALAWMSLNVYQALKTRHIVALIASGGPVLVFLWLTMEIFLRSVGGDLTTLAFRALSSAHDPRTTIIRALEWPLFIGIAGAGVIVSLAECGCFDRVVGLLI